MDSTLKKNQRNVGIFNYLCSLFFIKFMRKCFEPVFETQNQAPTKS